LAVLNALKTFVKSENLQVLLRIDNTTAISYINRFGGCRATGSHKIAKEIWQWCEKRSVWLFATYINTLDNIVADSASRAELDRSDFMLNRKSFLQLCNVFGSPEIDLFASMHTKQCVRFVSWMPDPEAEWTDAFTRRWVEFFYAFPPFFLITKSLK